MQRAPRAAFCRPIHAAKSLEFERNARGRRVALLYSSQIFGDFAGYTFMAIGVSKLLGYVLPQKQCALHRHYISNASARRSRESARGG